MKYLILLCLRKKILFIENASDKILELIMRLEENISDKKYIYFLTY